MKDIKLYHKAGPFGDETSLYDMEFEEGTTVQDLIDFALSKKQEWGYIRTSGDSLRRLSYSHVTEYRYGKIIGNNIPNNICQKKVRKGFASGGWTRMDYTVEI